MRLELEWLRVISRDERLMLGLRLMCQEVQLCRLPYAPLLALHYQLGGHFRFPSPEAGAQPCPYGGLISQ